MSSFLSIVGRTGKQNVVPPHNEIVLSLLKEENSDPWHDVDGTWGHYGQ